MIVTVNSNSNDSNVIRYIVRTVNLHMENSPFYVIYAVHGFA